MKAILSVLFIITSLSAVFAQEEKVTKSEYLTVRVQYGKNISGYKFTVFLDIGTSGAHSMSGHVTNTEDFVLITDDNGKMEFKSDIDLLNYLAKNGWVVIHIGEIDVLDQHYYTYLMERKYTK
jgi:hypothetical protein